MKYQDKQALEAYQAKLKVIKSRTAINPYETPEEKEAIIKRAKADPAFFAEYFFPHYASSKCGRFHIRLAKAVKRNKVIRRLVRWGRGLAKSVWVNTLIPLWLWVNDESVFLLIIGNNGDKAATLLDDTKAEFEGNNLLQHYFGNQVQRGTWESGDWQTADGKFIGVSLGMGQSPLGLRKGAQRPNYISCDDLEDKETAKNPQRQDEIVHWIENDIIPTMDGDTRRYLHPNNDPNERSIQNQLEKLHPKWEVDLVEAYNEETFEAAWPEKYDKDYYRDVEEDLGSINARAQYNHKKHKKGKIFTDELILWQRPPRLDSFQHIVGFWDVAYSGKNDYNAVKVWGLYEHKYWQLKAFVKQCKMIVALRFMYEYQKWLPKTVIVHWRVEKQFWTDPVEDAVKLAEKEYGYSLNIVVVDRPRANKYDRMLSMHPYYQNGKIIYNEKEQADNDMQIGINQLKGIEPGYRTHDDSPDADEQAVKILSEYDRQTAFDPRTTSRAEIRSRSGNTF